MLYDFNNYRWEYSNDMDQRSTINQCDLREWDVSTYLPVSTVPIVQNYDHRVSSNGNKIPSLELDTFGSVSANHMVQSHHTQYGKLLMSINVYRCINFIQHNTTQLYPQVDNSRFEIIFYVYLVVNLLQTCNFFMSLLTPAAIINPI